MKLEITIEKRHLFFVVFLIAVLGGLILVIAQTTPDPGHPINQVPGATPNCLTNTNHPNCQGPAGASWGLTDVAIASGVSWDSVNLGGVASGSYCRSDGVGCSSTAVYKVSANSNCQSSAFLCALPEPNGFSAALGWANAAVPPVWRGINASGVAKDCIWVLCTKP